MLSGTLPWYVARSAGLVAWGLLAASVVWGLLMTSKIVRRWVKNNWLLDLHRWLGGLAVVFTGVHVLAIMGDSYVHFGLSSVLVPLAAGWHPVAVAWGVVSIYVLLAVELTSLARRHIANRLWRRVHFLSFPLFVLATLHGLTAGTDSRTPMAAITVGLASAAVAALTVIRVQTTGRHPASTRLPRVAPSTSEPATSGAARRRPADPLRRGALQRDGVDVPHDPAGAPLDGDLVGAQR